MPRIALSILLIVTVVACPLWCRVDVCALGESQTTECQLQDRCCQKSQSNPQSPQHLPSSPWDGSCCDCQCLCGGAVLEANDVSLSELEVNPLQVSLDSFGYAALTPASQSTHALAEGEAGPIPNLCARIAHSVWLL